jgi:hypothetical protein
MPIPASQAAHGVHPDGDVVTAPRHCRGDLAQLLVGLSLLAGRHFPRRQVAQYLVWQVHDVLPVVFRNILATISSVYLGQLDVKRV